MTNYIITMTQTTFKLKEGTKTVYKEVSKEVREIDEDTYDNYINSAPFFRRMGGSETIVKCYCVLGYKPYKLTSKSPDKQTKIVREFDIKRKVA